MNAAWLERGGMALGFYFLARVLGQFRAAKRQRAALTTPLVDAAQLEAAFHPRLKDGDDPDLLAEVRDTLAHLNRQAYAEEFWALPIQLVALEQTLGTVQKATLRRALLRLLATDDRWLQAVGAKTAADLRLTDAVPLLQALLGTGEVKEGRFRQVLEEALAALGTHPAKPIPPVSG